MTILWIAVGVAAVAALGYWLLIITEGTYLGTRVVILLYDWTASRYNRIKKVQPVYEVYFLGAPLSEALLGIEQPRILDIATGTGRLPLAVLAGEDEGPLMVGIDRSREMLEEAAVGAIGVTWIQGDAHALMFRDASFDAVTCLEALEFMRDPRAAIKEMIRVLKPGGTLLVTNRVGWESWLFPGRYCRRGILEALLEREGLTNIDPHRWQTYYDLIWATRPAVPGPGAAREIYEA